MTTTCLINSYNYAQYVGEAVESALRQTRPFAEIIIVDDGSIDGSVDLLKSEFGADPTVQIVAKHNEGQLSCFNEGFARATGDVLFFLDADDVYETTYVERALEEYGRGRTCDFLFCGRRYIGNRDGISLAYPEDRDLGYSVIRTSFSRAWIGGATSCLSMRRQVLEKVLPLPFVDDWRTRADDCLVFGASLVGARKRFLAQPLVRYRVHDANHYCGKRADTGAVYRRRLALNRVFEYLQRSQCYNVEQLGSFPHREFETIEEPTFDDLLGYARISLGARVPIMRRVACLGSILRHYVAMGLRRFVPRRRATTSEVAQPMILQMPAAEDQLPDVDREESPQQDRLAA